MKLIVILFWLSLAATILLAVLLARIDFDLKNGDLSKGIVSFELAKTLEQSTDIISFWETYELKALAIWSIKLDYLYLLAYGSFFFLSTLLLSKRLWAGFLKQLAIWVMLIFVLASVLDAVENFALLQILDQSINQGMVSLAFYCAGFKFSLIGLGVIYLIIGLLVLFFQKKP